MRHLACISNGVILLTLLTTSCVSAPAETAGKSRRSSGPDEQKTIRITPPAPTEQEIRSRQSTGIADLMQSRTMNDGIDHEVKMPAAVLGLKESDFSDDPVLQARNERKMMRTDAEIAASYGGGEFEKKLGDVDRSLNLSEEQQQSKRKPSYLTGTRQVRELFAARRFEDALVEVNELLLHFPKSSLLWTMKGTLHLRMRQQELSLSSYEKAFEFEPSNQLLAQIEDLRRRLNEQERLRQPTQPVDVKAPEDKAAGEQK